MYLMEKNMVWILPYSAKGLQEEETLMEQQMKKGPLLSDEEFFLECLDDSLDAVKKMKEAAKEGIMQLPDISLQSISGRH